ncbi:LuxR family transcriptional regulator [Salmonella enterica]|nr:LuxR family transcriptional regulator [Salmonella enterica]
MAETKDSKSVVRIWHGSLCIEFRNDLNISKTEFKIISLLLKGYNNSQIAVICSRSIKTISSQKCIAFKRLGIKNDATLLPALILHGMVKIHTGYNLK